MGILERHADKWEPTAYGCWIWTAAVSAAPARRARVGIAGNLFQVVARLDCEENFGPPPTPKHQAAHNTPNGCLGGLCVAPHHLRWASVRENQADIPAEARSERTRAAWESRLPEERDNHRNRPRNIARLAGEAEYISGKPCKNGHVGPRRVSTGDCIECRTVWNAARNN